MRVNGSSRYPMLMVAGCFACGIGLSTYDKLFQPWGIAILFGIIVAVSWVRRPWVVALLMCVVLVASGYYYARSSVLLFQNHIALMDVSSAKRVTAVQGRVSSPPVNRQTARGVKTSFELSVDSVENGVNVQSYKGKILVTIFRAQNLQYGQYVHIEGRLHKPFVWQSAGRFSYPMYLQRNGIYWMFSVKKTGRVQMISAQSQDGFRATIWKCHAYFKKILYRYLNEFEAGFIQSLVLGGKYDLADRTRDLFVQTGTAHILAISGMNVASMALLMFILLNVLRLPRSVQIVATLSGLIGYCWLTGASPSVIRATVMAVVVLAGFMVERQAHTLNSLGLAALVILLIDPMSLWDIGFQLSFGGVLSMIYLYPWIYYRLEFSNGKKWPSILWQMFCLSLAAWIGIWPLVAYYFQIITPVSVVANIPIVPFVTVLFMLGVGLILSGLGIPWLAGYFAACIKIVLLMMMYIVELFARWPMAYWYWPGLEIGGMMMYYLGLMGLMLIFPGKVKSQPSNPHLHFLN